MSALLISEYAKQILLLMYKEEHDRPGVSFNYIVVGNDRLETNEKELIKAIKAVVDGDMMRILQSFEYLESNGYISAVSSQKYVDGSGVVYNGLKLTGRGIDFAEGVLGGKEENIEEAGLVVIKGDVNLSLSLDSIFKAEASDLIGVGKLADLIKSFSKN